MRFPLLMAVGLIAILSACHDDDDNGSPWGIGQSDPGTALTATGSIDRQNPGKTTYTVREAFLVQGDKDSHILRYIFTSNDSLDLIIVKRTQDYNYHSVTAANDNLLASALFNGNALTMGSGAAVSIQPRPSENRFSTVVNVHTAELGDFNGTVEHVPYITHK